MLVAIKLVNSSEIRKNIMLVAECYAKIKINSFTKLFEAFSKLAFPFIPSELPRKQPPFVILPKTKDIFQMLFCGVT